MRQIPDEVLVAIQRHFHAVIRGRAGTLIEERGIELPDLRVAAASEKRRHWLDIPGMAGGFKYWFEGEGAETKLFAESWCRMVDGSGERHEITAEGSRLVAEGFV